MNQEDAPERLWCGSHQNKNGIWVTGWVRGTPSHDCNVEYVRADLFERAITAAEGAVTRLEKPAADEVWAVEDRPIPEDAAIEDAFPTRSGAHKAYAEAMRMVGAKRSKGALVALVSWLIKERDEARAGAVRDYASVAGTLRLERDEARAQAEKFRGLLHSELIADMHYCETCEMAYQTPEHCVLECPWCQLRRLKEPGKVYADE